MTKRSLRLLVGPRLRRSRPRGIQLHLGGRAASKNVSQLRHGGDDDHRRCSDSEVTARELCGECREVHRFPEPADACHSRARGQGDHSGTSHRTARGSTLAKFRRRAVVVQLSGSSGRNVVE